MMWTDDEFEDIVDFFGGSVPDILIGLAEGYHVKPSEVEKIICKTDKIAENFAKKQRGERSKIATYDEMAKEDSDTTNGFGKYYRSPYESIIKNDIKSITEFGDGISKLGVEVIFKDNDHQKISCDDVQSDIDTAIFLCVVKHVAKVNGDINGSHAFNRIINAIIKQRKKLMGSSIENTIKNGIKNDIHRKEMAEKRRREAEKEKDINE